MADKGTKVPHFCQKIVGNFKKSYLCMALSKTGLVFAMI